MFVRGVGTANPPNRYSKAECWDAFKSSEWFRKLNRRSHLIAETVLSKDNGIATRTLAVDTLDEVFAIDPDTLHARFLKHAPALSVEAARSALDDAQVAIGDIDGVVVSTCTGYLCPGLTSYVAEGLGIRASAEAFDLVGQGCGAALPNWRMSDALIGSGACNNVLSICVEVSSAAMCLDDDPGVLISACLFGDGAGAAVLSSKPGGHRRSIEWKAFSTLLDPSQRRALQFETRQGMLRNILTRPVPRLAAEYAERVLDDALKGAGVARDEITAWIIHAGGRDVLAALSERLHLDAHHLRYSSDMLRDYGNMSSAFVYFVLDAALRDDAPPGWWWMSSFGAGFSCHGALLAVA